jgi:brefeldin A-resistance guanine nucleotide exchange factor 1
MNLPSETVRIFSEQLMAGFLIIAKTDMSILSKDESRWNILFRILSISSTHAVAAAYSFELTCLIISGHPDSPLTAEHFGECVDLLLSFSSGVVGSIHHLKNSTRLTNTGSIMSGSAGSAQTLQTAGTGAQSKEVLTMSVALERAMKAVEKLYNLHLIIPKLITLSGVQNQRAWYEFWLPVLSGLGQQCSHPSIDIRHQALSFLQRVLLSDELKSIVDQNNDIQHRIDCFDVVLFPVCDEVKAIDPAMDPIEGAETLVKACSLITKVFLHFSAAMLSSKDYTRIWLRILDYFESQNALKRNNITVIRGFNCRLMVYERH